MIYFFENDLKTVYAVEKSSLSSVDIEKFNWLFNGHFLIDKQGKPTTEISAAFLGPRASMVTPWSTNAVEIAQNMGIEGVTRIEAFTPYSTDVEFDNMLFQTYKKLHLEIFTVKHTPETVKEIDDIAAYNQQEGLALSDEEINYLQNLSVKIGRKLTDSEVFGFSQVNSEHCRHKIFNGQYIINGETKPASLFKLIKKTTETNPNTVISAYKDNVAFLQGPTATQFAPKSPEKPDVYAETSFESVLSLKAETHNFPTTVEPFNGAATGSGGEIRDRLAGGQGSLPLAGTAVYMTAYSRLEKNGDQNPRKWEEAFPERKWLYQTPIDILIKASNGASDFGNKFGQPLIAGSLLTFEHQEGPNALGFDKVIMLAGGIGYGKKEHAKKNTPQQGDAVVVMGGDNYRIGMGGAAVSSADTGEFGAGIELNAVQRSNPEMQKRVANTIRALVENQTNPVVSIHDHGAGGHLNCLSELVEETGGEIDLDKLPVGDPTLSAREIIGNESQERMGLVLPEKEIDFVKKIAERERAPFYHVGKITGDHRFVFSSSSNNYKPIDLALDDFFGNSPKMIIEDQSIDTPFKELSYNPDKIHLYVEEVLQLEAVACKDWLTNKVDRCVGGRVAKQQCVGPLQLPLNNCGVSALDFTSNHGIATSVGHAPVSGLIHPGASSRLSIAEALTNLVWAPLQDGIKSVSLSANWMWPCKNPGEDARLYEAVEACSEFAIALGINIPTGKDSLSMKQKYPDADVLAPGTVIISAAGHCKNIQQVVEPVLQHNAGSIYYIHFSSDTFRLGGSSFAQTRNAVGTECPDIKDAAYFKKVFNALQTLIADGQIAAGHDVGSGGLITTLLEMCFADNHLGAELNLECLNETDAVKVFFAENPAVVIQAQDDAKLENYLKSEGVEFHKIGKVVPSEILQVNEWKFNIPALRDTWFKTSYLLDQKQTAGGLAKIRFENYKNQPLHFVFPEKFKGKLPQKPKNTAKPRAAVLREKGSNSEREMANALYMAGFEVLDVHMTDLISGRENLENVQFLGAVGGFSNSDVLGSAKGWAGSFLYNEKARQALENFFARPDTLSVGICNGCQLFVELNLINPNHAKRSLMKHNLSLKHESQFTSVVVQPNPSVMLSSLSGSRLGVWISHGEGRFYLPEAENNYQIVAKYGYESYPANPNGSDYNTAMLCDPSGRHLVTMPHIERSLFPWHWAHYPKNRENDMVSPWLQAFVNAREWLEKQ